MLVFAFGMGQAQRARAHEHPEGSGYSHRHGHRHGYGHYHRHPHKAMKRNPYRPHRVVVYRPYWKPHSGFHRRWVFFPKYNVYWDNWGGYYVFWNGRAWISQTAVPPVMINVNLSKERVKELKEDEDNTDDIYRSNDEHKKEEKRGDHEEIRPDEGNKKDRKRDGD